MLVLLQQHRPHQACDRRVVGEDAHHAGAALDFLVDALEQVGAPDLAPVGLREVAEGEHVLPGLQQQLRGPWEPFSKRGGQVLPAGQDVTSFFLGKHRAQRRGHHALVSFWNPLQQVPGEMDPAALPAAALELASDRLGQAHVGVAHHELDASQAAFFERGNERTPEALALAVTHLEAQQLPAAVGVDAHGDDHGSGADLQGLAEPAVKVGGIEVEVGVASLVEGPVEEGLHLLVDLLTDAAHLRLGDAALHPQGRHQGVHLAGGDPADVGLHDHAVEGLIHPAAGLENRGQEAPGAQFGDQQVAVARLGGQAAGPVAVAVAEPLLGALMAISAEHGRGLQLDQLLQSAAHQLRDQIPGGAAI